MHEIVSVEAGSVWVEPARALFVAYREFLETIASVHCFDFPRYLEEVATLPVPYTGNGGELLMTVADGQGAGCIAYRHAAGEAGTTCEIKRLFIKPAYRRRGMAQGLIAAAMERARERGFTRVILDTDIVSMPAAYANYLALGYTEYRPAGRHAVSLRFLERGL